MHIVVQQWLALSAVRLLALSCLLSLCKVYGDHLFQISNAGCDSP